MKRGKERRMVKENIEDRKEIRQGKKLGQRATALRGIRVRYKI